MVQAFSTSTPKQQIGQLGEAIAALWLQRHQLYIVERNYQCRYGEIDLIALHESCLVFIEVRARRQLGYGSAVDSINYRKQQKIIKTAQDFLQHHPDYAEYEMRFDVMSIDYSHLGQLVRLHDLLRQQAEASNSEIMIKIRTLGIAMEWIAGADFG